MTPKYRIIDQEIRTIMDAAFIDTPTTWENLFENARDEITDAARIVTQDSINKNLRMFPEPKDTFKAFHLTPLNLVKAVIVGQDPYHGTFRDNEGNIHPEACGLCFSLTRNNPKINPSLRNIYEELKNSVPGFVIPKHGDLSSWARQGVLLLNKGLTVLEKSPGSQINAWTGFIKKALEEISKYNPKCIYVLWGKEAQKIKSFLPNTARFLEHMHPSGFNGKGFLGNNHFNTINRYIMADEKRPIDWRLD